MFLDTSVLVAASNEEHDHHERSFQLLMSQQKNSGSTAAHCMMELYSVMTRLPGKMRVSPQEALMFVRDVRDRLALVTLDEPDYAEVLDHGVQVGISGGAIYDALIARCALRAKADVLYTWNIRHFLRHEQEMGAQVRTP